MVLLILAGLAVWIVGGGGVAALLGRVIHRADVTEGVTR